MPFKQRVWHLPMEKITLSYWKRHMCPRPLSNAFQWKKLPFRIGRVTVSSFCWCDACWRWLGDLSLMKLSFFLFFFSSFIFPPLKITGWSSLLLIFQLRSLFFWFFYFCSWLFCKSFVCFQFHHSISICHILFFFQFGSFFI